MILTAQEFVDLCASQVPNEAQRTITDSASLEVWMQIIGEYPSMCIDVAQNRTIPNEVFLLLAKCDDAIARSIIASKGKLPIDLFSVLASDADERVRRAIAAHKKTPPDILEKLTGDAVESVASVALYNRKKSSKPFIR